MKNRLLVTFYSISLILLQACSSVDVSNSEPVSLKLSEIEADATSPSKKIAFQTQEKTKAKLNRKKKQQKKPIRTTYKYSYRVKGKVYRVLANANNFVQTGIASWYGPGFHKKKTASGERFNMYALTAAHKTLPLGSQVQVTNLANGKKVTLRINDRGPFYRNRIIDVSKKAAQKLGFISRGETKVKIKVIK